MKTGGCQCGAVRFRAEGEALKVYSCHCGECQKQSASAFGISAIYPPKALTVEQGEPRSWTRITKSGRSMKCWFCPDCGSRLWHGAGDVISIKGGALDETPEPQCHIWLSSKLPWVVIPEGAEQWEGEPDD